MSKYIGIVLVLIFVNGCGNKKGEPKPKDSNASEHVHNVSNTLERTDFIPEHIRNSTIEVVPHTLH